MLGSIRRPWFVGAVLSAVLLQAAALGGTERKLVNKINPTYPELARQMNVTGTVKMEIVIAENGTVKSVKPLGGHPLLIQSASEALRRWRYAPGAETTTIVEFHFHAE